MIQIEDNDLPITVAEKIITGTKPYNSTELIKSLATAITGNENAGDTQDMFDLEEIEEISMYLHTYYETHKNGD